MDGGGVPLAQDCPTLLIDSTTGHYNGPDTHDTCTNLWLASVEQRRVLERTFITLNHMNTYSQAYRKYTTHAH